MPAAQYRNLMITINNPPAEASNGELPRFTHESFACWQLEQAPTTGTVHVQAYVEFRKAVTFASVNRALTEAGWPGAHCEPRNGTAQQAVDYCSKEESRTHGPWQRGTRKDEAAEGAQPKLMDAVLEHLQRTRDVRDTIREFPKAYLLWGKRIKELAAELGLEQRERDDGFQPRPWQKYAIDLLKEQPDDRSILWFWDGPGNSGKSRLARHICLEMQGQQLEGRVADMAFAFNPDSKVVVFDLTRAQAENVDHICTFAEKLKNGMVFSSKYESTQKMFKPPHVIFFANIPPPEGKFSADRLKVVNIPAWVPPNEEVIDLTQDEPFM